MDCEYRIVEYTGRLVHKYQMPVYVTIIYLGESAEVDDPGGYQYALDDTFAYSLRYQVIRIPEIDGEKVLSQKGITEGQMKALMGIVEVRFGKSGLQELEPQIRKISEEQKLFSLVKSASVSSLNEFKKTLADI